MLPGDIINVSYGHAVRVLSVGDDPLGLSKIKKNLDCNDISQKNLTSHLFIQHRTIRRTSGKREELDH